MQLAGLSSGTSNNSPTVAQRPAPPLRPSLAAKAAETIRIAGLANGIAENCLDHPTQRVILADDLDFAYRDAHGVTSNTVAWNATHFFMQLPSGKQLCMPNYRSATPHTDASTADADEIPLPAPAAYRAVDLSHCDKASHTYAEFRLNTEHRLMGYCVNGKLVPSLLPKRCLYNLDTGNHPPGKWMCCKNVKGQAFAPYAAMLLLEGKRKEEVAEIANPLIDRAEACVSDIDVLLGYLENEGGSLKPGSINLRGETRGDAIQQIAKLLDSHQSAVMLVTGDRARLIDAIGLSEQGCITITFRDAYIGAQRMVADHDDFWYPSDMLPRVFDDALSLTPQKQNGRNSPNTPLLTPSDYLIYMVPRTPPKTKPKPSAAMRV